MSDVLHNVPVPNAPSSVDNSTSGGVATGHAQRGPTPSHERLQRRLSGYRDIAKDRVHQYSDASNAFNTQHKEDTKKLMKNVVDNAKPKKSSKTNSSSRMKPQIQQTANGLKRPHPGANVPADQTMSASEAKRMNLDSTAIKIEQKPDPNDLGSLIKSEPISSQVNSTGQELQNSDNAKNNAIKAEVKQELQPPNNSLQNDSSGGQGQQNNMSNSNDDSLNDFDLDLEHADFQNLIQDISDLNPDMLDFEFNDKSDFDDLAATASQQQQNSVNNPVPQNQNPMGPHSIAGPGGNPQTNLPNNSVSKVNNNTMGDLNTQNSLQNNIDQQQAASEKLKFMAQQRQQVGHVPQGPPGPQGPGPQGPPQQQHQDHLPQYSQQQQHYPHQIGRAHV